MAKCLDKISPNLYTGDDIEIGSPADTPKIRCPKCNRTWIADIHLVAGSVIRIKCCRCKQMITLAMVDPIAEG